jgi:hypothetical protein
MKRSALFEMFSFVHPHPCAVFQVSSVNSRGIDEEFISASDHDRGIGVRNRVSPADDGSVGPASPGWFGETGDGIWGVMQPVTVIVRMMITQKNIRGIFITSRFMDKIFYLFGKKVLPVFCDRWRMIT